MLKSSLIIIFVGFMVMLTGCSVSPKKAYQHVQPSTLPVRNITHFDSALQCFDDLLVNANIRPIYITSEGIPNHAGGEITLLSGRSMLMTTISKLEKSNVFRFIALPSLPASQLLEQLGIYKSHPKMFENYAEISARWHKDNPPTKQLIYPTYKIIGAISQVDSNVITGSQGGSISLQDVDFGVSSDNMVSIVTIDMNVMDTANLELLNGIYSSNSIAIHREGFAGDLGGRIKKAGVYLNFSFDKNEGTHQAIRTLLQLNTIEILGKLANIPYQTCLSLPYKEASRVNKSVESLEGSALYAPSAPIKLKHSNITIHVAATKRHYSLNDPLTFTAKVEEDAHVHCFFQNYKSQIWRVFPNQVQVSDFILANQPVSIPKQNKAFEIALDTANVTEQVMCLAAKGRLNSNASNEPVSTESLMPVNSFNSVLQSYQQYTQGEITKQVFSVSVE